MSENWGSIADMVSPPNHVFHYGGVGREPQLQVMLFGRSHQQDGNSPFWVGRLEAIGCQLGSEESPSRHVKSPSQLAVPKPMPSGHHRTDLVSASAYLHRLRCQLGTADRLQFGHGLAQLLDHQAGKSLESSAGPDNELKGNGMLGEFRQYQVADFARAHLVVDVDRI